MDIETAFQLVGGLGRFQILSIIAMCIGYNGGNYLYYGFPFLTAEQQYECRLKDETSFKPCSAVEVICPALEKDPNSIQYRIDKDYDGYMDNWYVEMDLVCANKF